MEKRKFTTEEKLKIIKEASEQGFKVTLEKYFVFPARLLCLEKENGNYGRRGFFSRNDPRTT